MLDANTDFNDRNLAENEEVIEKAINYLKYKDPTNANREYAIGLLKRMQAVAKTLADGSKLDFEEFINQNIQSQKD
jgi:hypothetical protein